LFIEQVTNFPILGVCDACHFILRLGLMGLLDLRQLLGEFLFLLLLLHEQVTDVFILIINRFSCLLDILVLLLGKALRRLHYVAYRVSFPNMLLQLRAKRPQHHLIIPEHLHGFQYLFKLKMLYLELLHLLLLFGLPSICPPL
jgi:hypothetical protein